MPDRNGRRRPFSSWMKRLANLKSSTESSTRWSNKRHGMPKSKGRSCKNNPYPLSGTPHVNDYASDNTTSDVSDDYNHRSCSQSAPSVAFSGYENQVPATSAKSTAPTISTNADTAISDAAHSKAGTSATAGGAISSMGGGAGSTFSSPAPSVRSLTTTLTTVQSAAPSGHLYNQHAQNAHPGLPHTNSSQSTTTQQVQFSHQFPPSPATAVPPHLVPHGHSVTYSTATANNILTDNASILTLASSSKRRRRNSLDTNASVRALAPSSVFGGSRESLPLSVLSGNAGEPSNTSTFNAPGVLNRPSLVGLASAERISVYSSSGAAPVSGGGERGSFYASKASPGTGDGASIMSGSQSHSRHDSNAASISGAVAGGQVVSGGRVSRRSSGWGEINGDESDEDGLGAKTE
ncbi:hypothetical protein HFD88_000236 [Aspergillus terreus]|nr:hypothetical protein HFD88_000236 [Aspergillus terreus]